MRPSFLLKWSLRELRRRWPQVAAVALVLGIGTGVYAGLGSTAAWRRQSNDDSFEQTRMYDLRVRAAEGADAPRGALIAALSSLSDPGVVSAAEERLILPTQVDASSGSDTILVPGRVIGVDTSSGGPHVNDVSVGQGEGRGLTGADAGQPVAVLERNFATFHDLAPTGRIRVAGGETVSYVGLGLAPEYFLVITEEGGFFAQANFAAVFMPLETAQAVTGRPGRVNDLVLRLRPGTDPARVADDVERAFRDAGPALGVTVMQREDEEAYRILYDDIKGDQRFLGVFAGLILAGAAFGAFNLASRMVEAQRREIGIGMALGATPARLALRPLLVGLQIALLGAILGVAMAVVVILAIRPVYTSMLPLPVWHTDLQPATLARGALLSFVLPLVATAWPVWRAVRVMPVDAISTTHRTARGGLARALRRMPRPLGAFRRMPIGNVLRTPRRTALTALGIGAAITTLVAILGMLDSFLLTLDRNEREVLQAHPDRVAVALDGVLAEAGGEVTAIAADPSVGEVESVLRVAGRLEAGGSSEKLDVLVEILDMDSEVWAPTVGRWAADRSGLVVSAKAAADLGVSPGDTVTLQHPVRRNDGVTLARSGMRISGIHPGPFRFNVYVDRSSLEAFGAEGLTNQLYVLPAPGQSADDVERRLFTADGVAWVQPVAASTDIVRDSIDDFTAVFRVLELFILLLALLIAYNASSINAEERAKERATLFAFGMPLRRVLGLETAEGLIIGALGTAAGIGLGLAVVHWVVTNITATTMPDLGVEVVISAGTVLTAMVMGVVAVAGAPLLTVRRLRRMDIPGTLRIVE